jgi:hypothetical protein
MDFCLLAAIRRGRSCLAGCYPKIGGGKKQGEVWNEGEFPWISLRVERNGKRGKGRK